MGGYKGHGFVCDSDALIFTLNQNKARGISKKDIWKGWSAVNTANFIRKCNMDLSPLK